MTQLNPFQMLRLEHLAPSPTNPRKHFESAALTDLAATIREHGVIEPIIVRFWPDEYDTPAGRDDRPTYEIIAGERRYRASQLAEQANIPALVRHLDTRQVLEIQIIENLQRRGVNELEEAEGYDLMMRDFGYTADQLAEKVGKSRAYIYGRLKLTALCEAARQAFREGKLDASRALLIARIPGAHLQARATDEITTGWNGPMAYREAARHIQTRYMLRLKSAPFPLDDGALVPYTGVCTACPKRAGNAPLLFQDVEDPDTCTDPDCFAGKKRAWAAQRAESARSIGGTVIEGKDAEKLLAQGSYRIKGYLRLDELDYDAAPSPALSNDEDEEDDGDKIRAPGAPMVTRRHFANELVLPLVTIINPRDGELVEVVKEDDYRQAMVSAGLHRHPIEQQGQTADREVERKAEQKYRTTLFEAIRQECRIEINGSRRPSLQRPEDLALVARQFWARIGFDAQVRLAKLHITTPDKLDNHERVRQLDRALYDFGAGELVAFLLELALIGTLDLPGYVDNIATPAPLLDTARRFGLDPDAIRAGKDGKAQPATEGAAAIALTARALTRPGAILYRHPDNAQLAWSGRGRKPAWVEHWIEQGGTLADLSPDAPPERCPKTVDMLETAS
jgi:ParB/RepB/Spo0J family partition protein